MCVRARMQEYTNYHFDCSPGALRGGLERFSQFFIAPLCKADALEREVNAVDNEFSGTCAQQTWPRVTFWKSNLLFCLC